MTRRYPFIVKTADNEQVLCELQIEGAMDTEAWAQVCTRIALIATNMTQEQTLKEVDNGVR